MRGTTHNTQKLKGNAVDATAKTLHAIPLSHYLSLHPSQQQQQQQHQQQQHCIEGHLLQRPQHTSSTTIADTSPETARDQFLAASRTAAASHAFACILRLRLTIP